MNGDVAREGVANWTAASATVVGGMAATNEGGANGGSGGGGEFSIEEHGITVQGLDARGYPVCAIRTLMITLMITTALHVCSCSWPPLTTAPLRVFAIT